MDSKARSLTFWFNWLQAATAVVAVFGLVLVLFPGMARQAFSLMIYASSGTIDGFRYVSLVHAVLGAVMFGWGVALFAVVRLLFPRNPREAWHILALSILAWLVPDTSYSLLSGFWPNAVLNAAFLVVFAIPLWATRAVRQVPRPG